MPHGPDDNQREEKQKSGPDPELSTFLRVLGLGWGKLVIGRGGSDGSVLVHLNFL